MQGNVRVPIAIQSSTYIFTIPLPQSVWLKTDYGFHVTFQGVTRRTHNEFMELGPYFLLYWQVLNNFPTDSSRQSQDSEEPKSPSQPWQASTGGIATHHCLSFLGLCSNPRWASCCIPPWASCCSSVPAPASCRSLSVLLCGELGWPCFLLLTAALSGGSLHLVQAVLELCWTLSEPQLCPLCSAPARLCLRAQALWGLLSSCACVQHLFSCHSLR